MLGKGQTPQQTQWQTAQHPGLSYLPDGWEFAIVAVKPPKGCNNTESKAVRPSSAGQRPARAEAGAGFPRSACFGDEEPHSGPSSRIAPSVCLSTYLASPGW